MNLFNIEPDFTDRLGKGPRRATERECRAYCDWLRQRRGLPDLEFQGLEWSGGYQRGKDARICIGATYGAQTAAAIHESGRWEDGEYFPGRREPAQFENGAFSVLMPGATQPATVTMETLGDAGEVLASQTLPIEPKKGGVIWSREAVRAAHGPVTRAAKPRKAKAAAEQPPIASPERATAPIEPAPAPEGQIAPEALSGPEIGSEPVMEVSHDITPDPLSEILARVAALEARLAPLSVESGAPPIAQPARRSPAHVRAVRRAWAERAKARQLLDAYNRSGEARRVSLLQAQEWEGECLRANIRLVAVKTKRRRSTLLARDLQKRLNGEYALVDRANQRRSHAEQRAQLAEAELARLKANLADPAQPERESDLVRLRTALDQARRELDRERNALAASAERAQRQEKALSDLADRFEAMVTRAARAEAELRRNGLAVAA